jgi:hypothetical protein
VPLLLAKFEENARGQLGAQRARALLELCNDPPRLAGTPVDTFMGLLAAAAAGR